MEQKIDLRDVLKQLGIKNIFTKEADLSAMTAEIEGMCGVNISQNITSTHSKCHISESYSVA